jgi:hypothetical protein
MGIKSFEREVEWPPDLPDLIGKYAFGHMGKGKEKE